MSTSTSKIPSRSRMTIVCTECKRLKVKCSRGQPCEPCAKRSNDPRICVYLTANTEKPDLVVLSNNQREAELKIDALAIRVDEIQEAYMPRRITVPPLILMSSSNGSHQMHQLDTTAALWISTLGILSTRINALPAPIYPSPSSRLFDSQETSSLHSLFFSPETSVAVGSRRKPVVTYALLQQLPSSLSRESLLSSLKSTLNLHPLCFFHYEIEARMRGLDDPNNSFSPVTSISVSFFAVVAASMTLGSLAYQVERKAWKMQSDIPENERDLTKLFDMARLAITLSGDTEDDRLDVLLALLILIVFTMHSLELDGYQAVLSGVVPTALQQQLRSLLDSVRQKAEISSLLMEPSNSHTGPGVWTRERRRMLAGAVAFYDFHVSDLIGNKITLDAASYAAEPPAPLDDRTFKPSCTTIPPPASASINHSTIFATHRARLLKTLLEARMEIVFMRDQERELMIAAAEKAESTTREEKSTRPSLPRSAGDTLEQWDERLHQQQGNLPHSIAFDTSAEYATDVAIVFAGEQRPLGPYESSVTLAMGYSIAQQTELAALASYYQMRYAALLLENALIYKPRGSPPSANGTIAAIRTLDAAQALLHIIKVQRHVLKKKMPLCLSSYVYGKRIFDAGVIFGVLCTIPATRGYERRSMIDAANGLNQCIGLLKDLETWMRLKEGLPEPTAPPSLQDMSPPLRVLEELADRAGIQVVDGNVENVLPKRKRAAFELEGIQTLFDGLVLPYVVGGVWMVGQPSAPASWLGRVEEVVPRPMPAAPDAIVSSVPVVEDEHRDKRVRPDGIVVEPVDPYARDVKIPSGERELGAKRPNSASAARRGIAVRARIQQLKRPKRRPEPPVNKSKSTSPDSNEEDYRFAYSIAEETTEYQQQQQQQQYTPSQYSTQPSNNLGRSLPHPDPKSIAPSPVTNGEAGQMTPVTESGSSSESSQTLAHGYNQDAWKGMHDTAAYNQQVLQAHAYPGEAAYVHQAHAPTAQHSQHQHYQHPPTHAPQHPQLQSSYAQSHASMPHEYQLAHQQPPSAHPSHIQYSQGYGYSGTESSARPPQLVIDASFNARAQAQVSQPSSAVTMAEAGVFYSNGVPMQSIGPGSMYQTSQEQYAQQWSSPDNYHYGTY